MTSNTNKEFLSSHSKTEENCGYAGPYSKQALEDLKELKNKKILVVGGCGFLGLHIVELLLECGAHVRVFDLQSNPNFDKVRQSFKEKERLEYYQGNLLCLDDIAQACNGYQAVFHCASPSPLGRNAKLFYSVNVDGTRNVLQACRKSSPPVEKLIFTSSASIVFDGRDQCNIDETIEPPINSLDDYTNSKRIAEQLLLDYSKQARNNGSYALPAICAIRPHSIFGPRDQAFVPKLAEAGRQGKNKWIIGSGQNRVDFTYVGNVAYAHALAAINLSVGSILNGETYFITNNEVVRFQDFVGDIFVGLGYSRPRYHLPYFLMYSLALLLSIVERISPQQFRPVFNIQSVSYSGKHHYYNSSKSGRHFRYNPIISLEEGKRRTLEYFRPFLHKNSDKKMLKKQVQKQFSLSKWIIFFLSIFVLLYFQFFTHYK